MAGSSRGHIIRHIGLVLRYAQSCPSVKKRIPEHSTADQRASMYGLTLNIKKANAPERATVTIEEAARMLGLGRSSAFSLAQTGQFPVPVIRAGRRWLVPRAPLERLLNGESVDVNGAQT